MAKTKRRTGRIAHGGHTRAKILGAAGKLPTASTTVSPSGDRTREEEQKRKLPGTYHRPADMSAAKVRAIDGMREGGTLASACRESRIGRAVLLEEMKSDPVFRRAMKHAHSECMDVLEEAMIARGRYAKGDLAGIFVLKHNRAKYREDSLKVEHTGKDGGPILTQEVKQALTDRLAKLADALATDAVVVGEKRAGPALVSDGEAARGVKRVKGSVGSGKPSRGVRLG